MEHREDEVRGGAETTPEGRKPKEFGVATSREATSRVDWQSGAYLLLLGLVCVLLAPLTDLWWLVLVLGAAVQFAPAVIDRLILASGRPDGEKDSELKLLEALAEKGELTPAAAAVRASLTINEASRMLEELASKGYLRPCTEDGVAAYALRERDRREISGELPVADLQTTERRDAPGASRRLDDPLSERELEVLRLLASGRTNAEVARNLFVSVGTVKSHTGNIYRKLEARNRAEALTRARDLNLLP
jgi:DNA-binding NarL/FixJ family response regulator